LVVVATATQRYDQHCLKFLACYVNIIEHNL
jgi:hypothetical protein